MQFYILFIKTWYTLIYCAIIAFFLCFVFIFYISRHTWATLAYHSGVPVGLISQSLGHSSIRVTMTYLKPFDAEVIDRINRQVISLVKKSKKKKDGRFNMLYGTSLRWNYLHSNGKLPFDADRKGVFRRYHFMVKRRFPDNKVRKEAFHFQRIKRKHDSFCLLGEKIESCMYQGLILILFLLSDIRFIHILLGFVCFSVKKDATL